MTQQAPETIDIGIDLGPLWSLHDGLGEFSVQYCNRLSHYMDQQRLPYVSIHLRVRDELHGKFGSNFKYLSNKIDQAPTLDLWHSLNQHNPPVDVHRVRERVVTVHDLNFMYAGKSFFSRWKHIRKHQKNIAPMNHVVTDSHYVKGDIAKVLKFKGGIEVIYPGVRDLSDTPQAPIANWNQRPFLFHLSRMAPTKNTMAMIDLARQWPDMDFILAGPKCADTEHAQALSQDIPNLRVMLDISDAEKSWLFAHCEAFLFPSLTEGFGLPAVEAMYFGKPVFLSRRTCLPEVGGKFCGYFDSFSPQAMKEVILKSMPDLKKDGQNIRNHARTYSWDRCATAYLAMYGRALGKTLLSPQ